MKNFAKLALAGTIAVGALAGSQTFAHHSAAMFDDSKEVILTGTVTKFDFLNPHSWLFIEAVNEDGSTTAWGFETAAPSRLQRVGVGPQFWKPGDVVTIKTHPLRDGRPAGDLVGSIHADGTEYGEVEGLTAPSADLSAAAAATNETPAGDGAGEEAELAQ
jgi:hypothetical protein